MRLQSLITALMAALLMVAGSSARSPVSAPLLEVTLDATAPTGITTIGITRTTIEPGGRAHVTTGPGPSVWWVEAGTIAFEADPGSPVPLVVPGDLAATPEPATNGGASAIEAGDGLVLAAGTSGMLGNDSSDPAIVLTLLSAPDTVRQAATGIHDAVVMSTNVTLPPAPVVVSFSLVVLEPGGHLNLPQEPAIGIFAARDQSQNMLVSSNGFSRAGEPIDVYILTIAPA